MNPEKQEALETEGWKFADSEDFLETKELTAEERGMLCKWVSEGKVEMVVEEELEQQPLLVPVKLLAPEAKLPTKAHSSDAGFDLYTPVRCKLFPKAVVKLNLQLSMSIPQGYYAQLFGKSSLAAKGIIVLGGVIDSGYQGSWQVVLMNLADQQHTFEAGEKVVQAVFLPVPVVALKKVEEFDQVSDRADGGFGSSGV